MNYKCEVCHDSGSKNLTGDYLDCPECDMPMIRKALNEFVKALGHTHPEDVALAIHQRALAMAPKQDSHEPVAQDCGACGGSGWVSRDADIGTEQECFSCDGSGKSDDAAPAIATAALTEEQVVCALGCIANGRNAGYISTENAKVVREFIRAAPAVANGALPDLPEVQMDHLNVLAQHYTADQIHAYGKACAAAGPDAALIEALQKIARWHGEFPDVPNDDGTTSSYAVAYGSNGQRDYMRQVALDALSGAKGN